MALDTTQLTTLKTAILTDTDAEIIQAVSERNDSLIAIRYNEASVVLAWREAMPTSELFENTPIAQFDGLSAGKRDAWRLMLSIGSVNCSKNKMRKGIVDIWDATQADNILNACTEYATKAELVYGGNEATSGTVTATKRNWVGTLSTNDVSKALNLP